MYLWFISARHNFLPTAGLALAVAAAGSMLTTLGERTHRIVPLAFGLVVTCILTIFVAQFVAAGLSEKHYWQRSYQLRRNLYARVVQEHLLTGKKAIVFEGFPQSLGPAPFFGQENELAVDYLYGKPRVSLSESSLSALQSTQGYYLYTEIDRYGSMPARFLPRTDVAVLVYVSNTGSQIRFRTSSQGYMLSNFYTVYTRTMQGTHTAGRPDIRSATLTGHGRLGTLILKYVCR